MTNSVGAWTPFMTINEIENKNTRDLAQRVFDNMFGQQLGVKNEIRAVRMQVVSGFNFQFLFTSMPVVPNAKTALKLTNPIYVKIGAESGENRECTVVSTDVWGDSDKKGLLGGWSKFHEPTAQDSAVFETTLKNLLGVSYTPEGVSSKIIDGSSVYRVYNAKGVVGGIKPSTGAYKILIVEDNKGNTLLLGIHNISLVRGTMSQEAWRDLVKEAVETGADSAEKLKDRLARDLSFVGFQYNTIITTTTTANDGGTNFDYKGGLWYANVQHGAWTYRAFVATVK